MLENEGQGASRTFTEDEMKLSRYESAWGTTQCMWFAYVRSVVPSTALIVFDAHASWIFSLEIEN